MEESVETWGAELLSNCPATEAQMKEDKRYKVESLKTPSGDQCASRLFPTANGETQSSVFVFPGLSWGQSLLLDLLNKH